MPLVIKYHTVPHLKGLNSGLEPSTMLRYGSNFIGPILSRKVLILLHRKANEQLFCSLLYIILQAYALFASCALLLQLTLLPSAAVAISFHEQFNLLFQLLNLQTKKER